MLSWAIQVRDAGASGDLHYFDLVQRAEHPLAFTPMLRLMKAYPHLKPRARFILHVFLLVGPGDWACTDLPRSPVLTPSGDEKVMQTLVLARSFAQKGGIEYVCPGGLGLNRGQ